MTLHQILREWPPGYGGVERVSHELGSTFGSTIHCLDVSNQRFQPEDPVSVDYCRSYLPSFRVFGRFFLPLPTRSLFDLLISSEPIHGHLPSPGVLFVLVLSRLLRPQRHVTAHWHCFLEVSAGCSGFPYRFYQWLALLFLPHLTAVVTTSPQLVQNLSRCGCSPDRLIMLPCCLSADQENNVLSLSYPKATKNSPLSVLFIGRLDSYKRLDWLLEALSRLSVPWRLSIVGDGPKRAYFEKFAYDLIKIPFGFDKHPVQFYGRQSEAEKLHRLADSDLLVLPSDRSNEAFGIVQLEAMAAGRPALAFDLPRSGMGWVCQLPSLSWSQSPDGLAAVLQHLADHPQLRSLLSRQARERYLTLFARSVWLQHANFFVDQRST